MASIMFAGLTSVAMADVAALGSILISAMEKDVYGKPFAAAITAASSVISPIISPSLVMLIYAHVMGFSVAALFLAGIIQKYATLGCPVIILGGIIFGVCTPTEAAALVVLYSFLLGFFFQPTSSHLYS